LEKKATSQKGSRKVSVDSDLIDYLCISLHQHRQKLLVKEVEAEQIKEAKASKFQALPKWKQDIIIKKQQENQPQ